MSDEPDRIIRIKTVMDRTGLRRTTLYRKMGNGTFPKQIRISTRCAGWRESAVAAWINNPMFYSVNDHPPLVPDPIQHGLGAGSLKGKTR